MELTVEEALVVLLHLPPPTLPGARLFGALVVTLARLVLARHRRLGFHPCTLIALAWSPGGAPVPLDLLGGLHGVRSEMDDGVPAEAAAGHATYMLVSFAHVALTLNFAQQLI